MCDGHLENPSFSDCVTDVWENPGITEGVTDAQTHGEFCDYLVSRYRGTQSKTCIQRRGKRTNQKAEFSKGQKDQLESGIQNRSEEPIKKLKF